MKGCLERWASARRSLNVSSAQGGRPPALSVHAAPSHQKSPLWTTNATSVVSIPLITLTNSVVRHVADQRELQLAPVPSLSVCMLAQADTNTMQDRAIRAFRIFDSFPIR